MAWFSPCIARQDCKEIRIAHRALRGALAMNSTALDIAPPISLRFPNYFAMRFRRGAGPLKKPTQSMCILLCMCPDAHLRIAARNLIGPIPLKGDVR